ncbi:hypothetical protein MNBD_PLANCTO02-3342 [hydrothermal vent metagenome]|uniref:Uncharacterized protein n=1 Tax=hydrothermal vent metagenome TaxID=652676 RepID=A0A3B1DJ17_9ZZZZ
MTGYTVHTGSSEKFTEGWDRVFETPKKPAKKAREKTVSGTLKKKKKKK